MSLSLTPWASPAQFSPCSIAAWIAPGHGFVEFNCGNTTSSIGFYPAPHSERVKTLTESLESFCEQTLQGTFRDLRSANRNLNQIAGQENPHIIQALNENNREMMHLSGYSRNLVGASSLIQSSHGSSFSSSKSSPSSASSSSCGKSSPSCKSSASPSITTAYHQLPPSSSLSGGFSTTTKIQSGLKSILQHRGWVRKDACALKQCLNGVLPCLTSRIETTPDKVEKALREVDSIRQELAVDESRQCPTGVFTKSFYKIWGGNCLDFMARVMDSTGIFDWRKKMEYTSPPDGYKMIAIAWHYFNFVLK